MHITVVLLRILLNSERALAKKRNFQRFSAIMRGASQGGSPELRALAKQNMVTCVATSPHNNALACKTQQTLLCCSPQVVLQLTHSNKGASGSTEVEDQLALLAEVVPEWLTLGTNAAGKRIVRLQRKVDNKAIRQKLVHMSGVKL